LLDEKCKVLGRGAKIVGKVKDINAYVVTIIGRMFVSATNSFGVPIRHIELEFGTFSGIDNEFIVPLDKIEKVIK